MYILSTGPGFFLVKVSEGDIFVAHIKEWKEFFQEGDSEVKVNFYKRGFHLSYSV